MREWADLHIHSNRSDGLLSPEEIVEKAAELELKAISIVDHDEIGGVEPAIKRGMELGVEIIPGVELSTQGEGHEVHIIGYFIDYQNELILNYLRFFQQERYKRAVKILERLKDFGINLKMEKVLRKAGLGSIGRPHIADALVEEGYVSSSDEAFYKYLADGRPACVPKFKISPGEAIDLISSVGGLSFLAHPGVDLTDREVIGLVKRGLDGIEVIHPKHTQERMVWLQGVIKKYGLLESGGSDCHGNRKGRLLMGKYKVPYTLVEKMKQALTLRDDKSTDTKPSKLD